MSRSSATTYIGLAPPCSASLDVQCILNELRNFEFGGLLLYHQANLPMNLGIRCSLEICAPLVHRLPRLRGMLEYTVVT